MRQKDKTPQLMENAERSWRALKKDKLGAVIFGCKRHTIMECIEKKLFGLPAPHYAYIKNVTAGLTLYLFNYTDRKLHGIFEAVSCGKMNINPYAWITSEGTELTPFPAQVQIRERRKCCPLLEEQIMPIIARNYYTEKLFWFELDKEQNRGLTKLFLSTPLSEKLPRIEKWPHHPKITDRNMFDVLSNSSLDNMSDEESENLDSEDISNMVEVRLRENENSSASANTRDSCAPETKWANLFKPSMSSGKNEEVPESDSVRLSSPMSDCFDTGQKVMPCSHQMSKLPEVVCQDAANPKSDSRIVQCLKVIAFADVKETYENKVPSLQYHDQDSDITDMLDVSSSEIKTSLDGEGELMLSVYDYVLAEKPGEVFYDTKEKVRSVLASLRSCERDHDQLDWTGRAFRKDHNPLSNVQSVISKLMQEVDGLKASQLDQSLKIESLEHELILSKLEIDQVKKSCHKLESKASCVSDCNIVDSSVPYFKTGESVFIAGGYDGHSWLPDLSLYSPYQDKVISRCSMSSTRTYAAMAKLNSELYIFGGTVDGVWCNLVESYNPISNQWVQKPSLKMKKGSPAGASMYNKIFAIGGGNGSECFSDVELFDPNIGSWIFTQFMLEKRFAPAAAVMNNAVYVTGGYDGKDYLRSVERYDPRERDWTSLGSMLEKRGCHSLVAFNEKLYAIGGYNGYRMVSSVEIFDPRMRSWVVGESMRGARGYFGSFVIGGKIYIIGGLRGEEVLDVVSTA